MASVVFLYLPIVKVISTNIAEPVTVLWRGRQVQTGIYKHPTQAPIYLGKEEVTHDTVVDRKHHGGAYKACYLFSSDYYDHWKEKYPSLEWDWGMFGENLTVAGLDENQLRIGDIYKIGHAVVQVTEPRQPCYKLGIKFGTQQVLREFVDFGHPGTYVRILTQGKVAVGDELELLTPSQSPLTVQQFSQLVNRKSTNAEWIKMAIANDNIPDKRKAQLKKML